MREIKWIRLIVVALAVSVLAPQAFAQPAGWQRGRPAIDRDWQGASRDAYDRGYREGIRAGEQDARSRRAFAYERDRTYRDGDRGYNQRYGSREAYRDTFRRGFANGYRAGFNRVLGPSRPGFERQGRLPAGYQDPAFARGFSDGFEKGLEDARDRDRYDPVRHGDYRSADDGYRREYGSKDAYRNNYRTGFRQGYEQGYRDGSGRRR